MAEIAEMPAAEPTNPLRWWEIPTVIDINDDDDRVDGDVDVARTSTALGSSRRSPTPELM